MNKRKKKRCTRRSRRVQQVIQMASKLIRSRQPICQTISDDENPLLLKKPKRSTNPLYPDMSEFPPCELTPQKDPVTGFVDWLKGPGIKPHVAIKNLNGNDGNKPVPAVEVGVRFNF